MSNRIRVRFAPSPTGPLHIGGVRTALYNYLFARRHGGDFILRIEDTDSQRYVPGAEQYIVDSLRWCGIEVDEGIGASGEPSGAGPHAPYRQSERKELYLDYAMKLVETGNAYYAFDTPEELDAMRAEAEAAGETFSYDHKARKSLSNSLALPAVEVENRIKAGEKWVIRFRMPEDRDVVMNDIIRGEVTINTSTLDDKVLYKSADQLPTYHLANIVDDHLMEISHVIRGEEWLPSLPLHYLLYEAFGWERPMFAHLPLLLKPTGQGKLSKRDGDKLGFPVFPLEWHSPEGETARGYREDGYFPDAFINMLALLGWNPGTEQEIFTMQELIEQFSLDRVGKSGARFSPEKALWFNTQYMHHRADVELAELFAPVLSEHGIKVYRDSEEPGACGASLSGVAIEKVERIVSLIKERATFVKDFWELSSYMFVAPQAYDEKPVKKFWKNENPGRVAEVRDIIAAIPASEFTAQVAHDKVAGLITEKEYPMGQVMNCIRLAVVGESKGPDMFAICEILGQQETVRRISRAIEVLGTGAGE